MWPAKIFDNRTLKIRNQQWKDYWVLILALYDIIYIKYQWQKKNEQENDQGAYIDINELDFKPSPNEDSPLIFGSFEDLYEGRFQF